MIITKPRFSFILLSSLILALSFSTSSFAKIYRWTDDKGKSHFSDKSKEGAEELKLPDLPTYDSDDDIVNNESSIPMEFFPRGYKTIAIAQPQQEATIRNNQGLVSVNILLEPQLTPGDKLVLILDGKEIGDPQNATTINLSNIDRGAHQLSVNVVDSEQKIVGKSEEVTFYMHRPRVNMVPKPKSKPKPAS